MVARHRRRPRRLGRRPRRRAGPHRRRRPARLLRRRRHRRRLPHRPPRRLRPRPPLLGRRVPDERPHRPLPEALRRADAGLRHGRRRRRRRPRQPPRRRRERPGRHARMRDRPRSPTSAAPRSSPAPPAASASTSALTGHRMGPGDAILAGFADHFVPEARWPELAAALDRDRRPGRHRRLRGSPPPRRRSPRAARRSTTPSRPPTSPPLAARLETSDWGHGILKTLAPPVPALDGLHARAGPRRPPRPRHREGARAASTASPRAPPADGELLEGIRAAVIDKDRNPVWRDDMDSLRPEEVAAMLAPLGADELEL